MDGFDHERLDAYRTAIEFVAWVGDLLDGPLAECRKSAVNQLDRASTSVALNIAEGNGKRSVKDRCRFLDIARGSALESAACLDVLVARKVLVLGQVELGKVLLIRVVQMLSRWTASLLAPHGESRRSWSGTSTSTSRSTSTSTSTSTKKGARTD